MKKVVKNLFHLLGFDIIKYKPLTGQPPIAKKSLRTNNLTLHNTITGNYYLPTDAVNDVVANTIINNEIFEREVVELAAQYIKPGSVVLDLGANFGQMSILFSNMVGENGKVYSFDADDWVYEILCKNINANEKQGTIIPHFGALHNKPGEILIFPEQDFKEYEAYGAYGIDYTAKKGREVRSITIDSLNIQEPVSFIKIDIQGGDLLAMQGAVNTIEKNKCPILFEYEYHFEEKYNLCFQEYVDFVRSIEYKFHKVKSGHNFLIIPQ